MYTAAAMTGISGAVSTTPATAPARSISRLVIRTAGVTARDATRSTRTPQHAAEGGGSRSEVPVKLRCDCLQPAGPPPLSGGRPPGGHVGLRARRAIGPD